MFYWMYVHLVKVCVYHYFRTAKSCCSISLKTPHSTRDSSTLHSTRISSTSTQLVWHVAPLKRKSDLRSASKGFSITEFHFDLAWALYIHISVLIYRKGKRKLTMPYTRIVSGKGCKGEMIILDCSLKVVGLHCVQHCVIVKIEVCVATKLLKSDDQMNVEDNIVQCR